MNRDAIPQGKPENELDGKWFTYPNGLVACTENTLRKFAAECAATYTDAKGGRWRVVSEVYWPRGVHGMRPQVLQTLAPVQVASEEI